MLQLQVSRWGGGLRGSLPACTAQQRYYSIGAPCVRDDNGSHFLTRDPGDPSVNWPVTNVTHDYSRVMTPDYCSFQSGPLSGSPLKIKHHHCHKIACSLNLVNLIMGQRVTSTDQWPTWPTQITQICWPTWPVTRWTIVISALRRSLRRSAFIE